MASQIYAGSIVSKNISMKKSYILFALILSIGVVRAQPATLGFDTVTPDRIDRTLKAATTMCAISFIYQAVGIGFFIGATTTVQELFGPLSVGVIVGTGGMGMELNNAQLTSRAYNQIRSFWFTPEDSLLKTSILKNMKTARNLARIQNVIPFIALTMGGFAYLISCGEDQVFYITTISLYASGLCCTAITEILLIEKTRRDLNNCQKKLTIGPSKYGMGMIFHF